MKGTRMYPHISVLMQLNFNEYKIRYIGKIILNANYIAVIEYEIAITLQKEILEILWVFWGETSGQCCTAITKC